MNDLVARVAWAIAAAEDQHLRWRLPKYINAAKAAIEAMGGERVWTTHYKNGRRSGLWFDKRAADHDCAYWCGMEKEPRPAMLIPLGGK